MNILKSKGPKVDPCGTPDFTTYEKKKVPEMQTEDCLLITKSEWSLPFRF
jgi:hypothetical protein